MVAEMERLYSIGARLKDQYRAERVLLYGSYATGTATIHSDIDLLIIAPTQEKFYDRIATALRLVRDLCRGLPLSPLVLKPEEVVERQRRGDQFIQEIMKTGIEL